MIAYEAGKLEDIARIEKTPQFVLLLSLIQDPSSTVSSALDAHSDLTSNIIADAKKELAANGKTSFTSESGLLKNHPYNTWRALLVLVARTPPAQQSKLIEFILGLQKIEVVDRDTSQPEVLKYYDMEFWRQLPGFGWETRDIFNIGSFLVDLLVLIHCIHEINILQRYILPHINRERKDFL
jgi:hypothetical protein